MKLLTYIVFIIAAGLILLRLLYIDFFGNLPIEVGCSKDTVYSCIFVVLCLCAVYCCIGIIVLYKRDKLLENMIKDLRDGHNNFVDEVSKFADDYNRSNAKTIDTLSAYDDRLCQLENQINK